MSKIILEDLKFKKKRRQTLLPKESLKELKYSSVNKYSENIEIKENPQKENKKNEDEKIEQFLKKMHHRSNMASFPVIKEDKPPVRRSLLYFFTTIFILGAIYLCGVFFENANIKIVQRTEILSLNNERIKLSSSLEDVGFEIMITSLLDKQKINLTEKENVSIKSKGEVVLYNEFSDTPQKLQAGSFLVDENGKSYKIDSAVTIPGYKKVDGNVVPGEISVAVSSFLAGEGYNGSPNNFYITIFKNTDKYNKIYGKLKSPLVGGMAGEAYKLNNIDKDNIKIFANSSLKNSLLKKVKAEIPSGYIYYEDATSFSYNIVGGDYFKNKETEVEILGEIKVVLIKEEDFKNKIINLFSKEIPKEELKNIKITNLNDLSLGFEDTNQLIDKKIDNIICNLSGEAVLLWSPDLEMLKVSLLGKNKKDFNLVLSQNEGISHASLKMFPPWNNYLPKELSKIKITWATFVD